MAEPTADFQRMESKKAKALYLRTVEMACDMTPFLNQMTRLFESLD